MAIFNIDTQGIFPVMNGMEPKEGRRVLPLVIDFSAGASWDLYLKKVYETKQMTTIQTLFLNNRNAAAGADDTVTIDATGQLINVTAHTSGYFPILTPKEPQKLTFASTGNGLLYVMLLNFYMPPAAWS